MGRRNEDNLLRRSFCLAGGLGLDAERRLWRNGVVCWDDYRRQGKGFFSPNRHARVLAELEAAEAALVEHDVRFFLKQLPPAARVRVWPLVSDRAVYLDVETTGLGQDDYITTAVIYCGQTVQVFVRDHNLHDLPQRVPADGTLVTYNGRRFDLPRLRAELKYRFRQPHLDLAPVLRAAGYGPGLKACERQLGVRRGRSPALTGADAVCLWRAYERGDFAALERLVTYNVEDALVLERLLVAACNASMHDCPMFRTIPLPSQSAARAPPRGRTSDT